jgi:chromosome segregation ATPase
LHTQRKIWYTNHGLENHEASFKKRYDKLISEFDDLHNQRSELRIQLQNWLDNPTDDKKHGAKLQRQINKRTRAMERNARKRDAANAKHTEFLDMVYDLIPNL